MTRFILTLTNPIAFSIALWFKLVKGIFNFHCKFHPILSNYTNLLSSCLAQDCNISNALIMDLLQSGTKPLISSSRLGIHTHAHSNNNHISLGQPQLDDLQHSDRKRSTLNLTQLFLTSRQAQVGFHEKSAMMWEVILQKNFIKVFQKNSTLHMAMNAAV